MGIFSKPPKSFKLDRKSPFAADLKSAISDQLSLFLGPVFADDILTEYVTVLVCNGKTQNQARDDLDAFLGDRSEAFVSWLWDFLLKNERQCKTAATLKDKDDILTYSEDTERRRNALEVNSEKTGHAVTLMQMEGAYQAPKDYKPNSTTSEPHISDTECRFKFKVRDHQKTENSVLPELNASSPERGLLSEATSPLSENAQNRQISGNLKNNLSPTDLGSLYCDKVQVSVWDRLSRPVKAALTDKVHADNEKKHKEVRREVVHQCKRNQAHTHAFKHVRMHNFHNNLRGDRFMSDNWRKRSFFQINQSDSSLVGARRADNFYNNLRRPDKRSKFVAKAPKDLLSTVEAVKLRLQLMEREISLLRSRNIGMGNDQRNNSSINSDVTESTVEDHESRSVIVSNVHYAAKREALSSYFTRCGRVVNVVLMSDFTSFAPDSFVRSAYITFASTESIDKALSLSGATFYSRALKVVKYKQKDTLPAVSTSPALSYTKRPAQQSAVSEQSVPEPALISPVKDVSGNSNIHNAESVAEKTDEAADFSASGDQKPILISPIKDIAGSSSSDMLIVVESDVEKISMEAEFSASGDEQHSLISPMKDVAGCTKKAHNAESVAEKKIDMGAQVSASEDEAHDSLISPMKDVAGCTKAYNAESVAEKKIDMAAQVSASEDEHHYSLISPVEDVPGCTNAHNVESVVEKKIDIGAQVSPYEDEQHYSLISPMKDVAGCTNAHNAESVAEKKIDIGALSASEDEQHYSLISPMEDDVAGCTKAHNAESVAEKKIDMGAQVSASEDEQHYSLILPMKDVAGCTNAHNVESVAEKKIDMGAQVLASEDEQHYSLILPMKDVAGCTNAHNAESVAEKKIDMAAQVSVSEDEQHSSNPPVKDISGFTNMHNAEPVAEKTNMEAEVSACGDEQPYLILDLKCVSENITGADNMTSVACIIEEQQCSDSCESVNKE